MSDRTMQQTNVHVQWMDDFPFYAILNGSSVISGRWEHDEEKLYAVKPVLRLRRFCIKRDSNPGPLDQNFQKIH